MRWQNWNQRLDKTHHQSPNEIIDAQVQNSEEEEEEIVLLIR